MLDTFRTEGEIDTLLDVHYNSRCHSSAMTPSFYSRHTETVEQIYTKYKGIYFYTNK